MKPIFFEILSFAVLGALVCRAEERSVLEPGIPAEVFVAPGRVTTILFRTKEKVAAISLGSPVVTYKYDKDLNQLELTPAIRTGGVETNANLRIGNEVYVLVIKVVTDVRAQFVKDFDLKGDAQATDEPELKAARPLAPSEVDIVGAAKTFARAENDPVFRQAHPELRIESLGKRYLWNDCLVTLVDLGQFVDQDLIVFRVSWMNSTRDALYLDPGQYGLFVAGSKIPILARYKVGAGSIVYPGQLETVYLAVQGYRLSRENDWQLGLPPDAEAVGRVLKQ